MVYAEALKHVAEVTELILNRAGRNRVVVLVSGIEQ